MTKSSIVFEQIISQALENNPLGDPFVRTVPVYLPPGYPDSTDLYPVVYFLSGFSSRGLGLLNDRIWDENIQQQLDRLITLGEVQPLIAVLPDCSTRYGGSQYLNSSGTGRYTDHLLEVVAYIDQNYPTKANRDYRAVAGISSGGFGALRLGMEYADYFGLIADHSGDKYFEYCYKPDFIHFLHFFDRAGEAGFRELLNHPGKIRPRPANFFAALNIAAMASCYSPNPAHPLGFDLPMDPNTGEVIPQIWQRWEAHDPVNLIDEYAKNLNSLRLLYFECGARDEYNLQYGSRILAQRLKNRTIPHLYHEFDDGHRGLGYRYDVSLRLISQVMSGKPVY